MYDEEKEKFELGLCILWNIWKARNDLVFSGISLSLGKVLKMADMDFMNCIAVKNDDFNTQVPEICSHTWVPPPPLCTKINVDATFIPNKGVAGAIAHDSSSCYQGCGTSLFDATSPMIAETKAVLLGVELAKKLHLTRVIIEGDASNVTATILGDNKDIP
ncbi:uncharacterized protein LOC113341996 [Papaver somniferum]|uniref:uncharacterized protein LOC113341996 n=1 Tax=Papaver somniferum TaxID=3469 RepID=UPI000E6FEFD2|nr:uncharacterized protein LOC113341996 [Papaver somniferum]